METIKAKFPLMILWIAVVLVLSAAFFMQANPRHELLDQRTELIVRDIGHQLLLSSGDSSSRVLPVRRINEHTVQLEFQHPFSFVPDSIVNIVKTKLASGDLDVNYMVNVLECSTHDVVYGFEVRPALHDIVPCQGRQQPLGCYSIQISFYQPVTSSNLNYYLLAIAAVAGVGLLAFVKTSRTSRRTSVQEVHTPSVMVGKYAFDSNRHTLTNGPEVVRLSFKESKVLGILAMHANEVVSRDHLLKEVWENEGVFTGRSLDMFISKLRKKLKGDPSVQITNVHGVGYKLEM